MGDGETLYTLKQAMTVLNMIERWQSVHFRKADRLDGMPEGSLTFVAHYSDGQTIHGGILPDGSSHT